MARTMLRVVLLLVAVTMASATGCMRNNVWNSTGCACHESTKEETVEEGICKDVKLKLKQCAYDVVRQR
jgi:hypothetical protein